MELFLIHNEWNDVCILDNNNIIRKNICTEKGYYYYEKDILVIKWNKWKDINKFKKNNNYYLDINSNEDLKIIEVNINDKNKKYILINNHIIEENSCNSKLNRNKYIIDNKYLIIYENNINIFYKDNLSSIYYKFNENIENKNIEIVENNENKNNEVVEKNENNEKIINSSLVKKNSFNNIVLNYDNNEYKNNKNIYILNEDIFYSYDYFNQNKIENNKYYCYDFDITYNSFENLFYNFPIYNINYLNYDNYEKLRSNYIIDKKKILDTFFKINFNNINNTFIDEMLNDKKKIVTLSEWGYPPFGGGENWLLNLSKIFNNLDYDTYIICFSNGFNGNQFKEMELIDLNYVKIIQMEYNLYEIMKIIKFINPCLINHQGIKRIEFMKIANVLEIPFITGYCFWNNIIKQNHSNIGILDNNEIEKDSSFSYINNNSYVYCASDFVNDVIHKFFDTKIKVIETISLKDDYNIIINKDKNIYVSLLNCHYNKGGFLIKDLINKLDINIPLLFVYTEYDPNLELSEIKNLINERNNKNNINLLFEEKQNPKEIYEITKLMLIPSLCDETFCRVAYESKMNNIPVISTSNGNLKYLLKNYALFIDNNNNNNKSDEWIKNIESMYKKININLKSPKNNLKNQINTITNYENKIKNSVKDLIDEVLLNKSKYILNSHGINNNIAIIAPWADQGLGIQARSYYNSLKQLGYNVHIFSFKPYHGNENNSYLQHNKEEWNYDNIYYSPNHRENIDAFEILNFIHDYKIRKLIVIEATFEPIFKIMSLLKLIGVQLYLIVNIECVKISEINYHLIFDKVFCNNYNSYFIMKHLLMNNVYHLGFHFEHDFFKNFDKKIFHIHKNINKINSNKTKLKFVCNGGLNSISRKNIDIIYDSFLEILNQNKNQDIEIELYVYIQSIECPSNLSINHPNIHKQIKYLSYYENLESISKNDIFIHCGGQEGLGLGFYEALYLGLPIITLNWTPNNEIVKDNYNGWLIDVNIDKVYENTECLINRGLINKSIFINKINEITNNIDNTTNIINNTINNRFNFIKNNKNKFENNIKTYF